MLERKTRAHKYSFFAAAEGRGFLLLGARVIDSTVSSRTLSAGHDPRPSGAPRIIWGTVLLVPAPAVLRPQSLGISSLNTSLCLPSAPSSVASPSRISNRAPLGTPRAYRFGDPRTVALTVRNCPQQGTDAVWFAFTPLRGYFPLRYRHLATLSPSYHPATTTDYTHLSSVRVSRARASPLRLWVSPPCFAGSARSTPRSCQPFRRRCLKRLTTTSFL